MTTRTAELCGTIAPTRAMELHPRYVREFLDQYLRGIPSDLLDAQDPAWPEATAG
ncbi:hypothetical protein [Nocardia gamkensis]|uniref:hypothetical protein n=1 Tax=Nocardia gamkensis TaxID=352869 RepID=UPI0037CAF444